MLISSKEKRDTHLFRQTQAASQATGSWSCLSSAFCQLCPGPLGCCGSSPGISAVTPVVAPVVEDKHPKAPTHYTYNIDMSYSIIKCMICIYIYINTYTYTNYIFYWFMVFQLKPPKLSTQPSQFDVDISPRMAQRHRTWSDSRWRQRIQSAHPQWSTWARRGYHPNHPVSAPVLATVSVVPSNKHVVIPQREMEIYSWYVLI